MIDSKSICCCWQLFLFSEVQVQMAIINCQKFLFKKFLFQYVCMSVQCVSIQEFGQFQLRALCVFRLLTEEVFWSCFGHHAIPAWLSLYLIMHGTGTGTVLVMCMRMHSVYMVWLTVLYHGSITCTIKTSDKPLSIIQKCCQLSLQIFILSE